jgi:hypothetical protein
LEYRSVKLTLLYGFSSALYILLIIAARIFQFSCIVKLWITDIFVVISVFSVMSMGIRIIYLWKLNCYKLTNSKRKPITYNNTNYEPEANTYFKAVYKLINKISKRLIILPIIFDFIITGITSFLVKDNCSKSHIAFAPIIIFSIIFSFTCPYLIYQLHKVNEYQRITTKVEYILTTITLFILISLYIIVTVVPKYKNNELLQYYTNEGVFFFVIQEFIGFLIIMNIPFIELLCDKKNYKNLNLKEQISIEYFYKLINDPIIIEELKEVAISEFSIENVLFWESYRELMNLSKYKKGNAIKKIFNGISNVHKSIKQNNNNKITNNQISNNFLYEKNNSGSNKYNKLMNNENCDSYDKMNENQFYSNNFYDNNFYSRNHNTNKLLKEFNGHTYMKESITYGTPKSPTNYPYIDENMNDKYNSNYYYYYSEMHGQRRRSINQYNINMMEERLNISEKSYDTTSSASSEVTADTPVPLKLYNYYQNFYHTFINVNSTAAVNINCSVRENIENGIKNPKIGIFDEAKEEVILLMFRNLCPKLIIQLKQKEMI